MLTCSVDLLLLTECKKQLCQICGSHCRQQNDFTFTGLCIANIFTENNQQDATFHTLFISARRSICFRRFFRPSSGAQNCTYSVRYLSDQYCYLPLAQTFHTLFISARCSTCLRRFFIHHQELKTAYRVRYLSDQYCYLLLAWRLAAGSSIGLTLYVQF